MKSGTKMFTVDKFLGINEAADGFTELKMGQASEMKNFLITDGFNLKMRPGVKRMDFDQERSPAPILASWAGFISEDSTQEHLLVVDFADGTDRIWLYTKNEVGGYTTKYRQDGALGLTSAEEPMVKIFAFGGKLWVMSRCNIVSYQNGEFVVEEPYVPLVVAGASPSGGGTTLEGINMLSSLRRIDFSADGEATAYVLPPEARKVEKIIIDNFEVVQADVGAYDMASHTFTFKEAPEKGVGNVEFTYNTYEPDTEKTRLKICGMPLMEAYNGSTDTRLFVGGKGNICYYTGVTQSGEATPMYFPAMNEAAVDMTGASVTGLVRHYSKLLVFTRGGGAYTLSYEPVTTEDGTTTAGFYLRSANREFGNDVVGQVRTVNNYPRTITQNGIYEWRITSSYYQDERYAQCCSDLVQRSLRNAPDIHKFVTCDNNYDKTYYVFLNDELGTVLVDRYDLTKDDIWCVYQGDIFKGVTNVLVFDGNIFFTNDTEVFCFSTSATKDAPVDPDGEPVSIKALWESGYMDYGADFRRKFNSDIYLSVLPQAHSELIVTAETDRRSEYTEKTITTNIFDFSNLDFANFTFDTNNTPKIHKIRLKAKKFVYYKLVFRVDSEGATATVLSFDQKVRFGSMAK